MDEASGERARNACKVQKADTTNVERVGGTLGNHKEGKKVQGRGKDGARGGAGQRKERQREARNSVVCSAGAQGAQGEGRGYRRAVVRSASGYFPAGQNPGMSLDRGTIAGDAPRKRGRCRGWS